MTDEAAALGAAAARLLADAGRFPIGPGLSDGELDAVEKEFAFSFADDHRAFLAAGLPTGRGWPDWRTGDRAALRERLAWPVDGVLFDVVENSFWYEAWGPRPVNDEEAARVAKGRLVLAPRMLPVYSHRYLPAGHGTHGHPVLSIYQTDVVCYGRDLADFMRAEFGLGQADPKAETPHPTVDFWSRLV